MDKKTALLGALAGKNRGLLANELDKIAILDAIAKLEDENPTPKPVKATHLLEGDWRLLYTTSRELLGLDRFPLLQLGQIYQCLRPETEKVYNLAEVVGVPFLDGLVCVTATFSPASERRVNVKFERSIFGLQRFLSYQSPQAIIKKIESGQKFPPLDFNIASRDRQGWIDITYLDDNLRINRGNEGSVFILTKDKGLGIRD